jgi:hypothetical protein
MHSGQRMLGAKVELLDGDGQVFAPENVSYAAPLDITVETELEAEIEPPSSGFGSKGVVIHGDSQLVRVSTEFGTLAIYELIEPADVDSWELPFWSEDNQHGIFQTEVESGMTYPSSLGCNAIGADARLIADGEALCSFVPYVDEFEVTSSTSDMCVPAVRPMGHFVEVLKNEGRCEFNVAYPAAKGGQGLEADFSITIETEEP